MATMRLVIYILLLALGGCRTDGAALSNVYPGYAGYAQPSYVPPYQPYRAPAPVTTHCTRIGIDGERVICQSY